MTPIDRHHFRGRRLGLYRAFYVSFIIPDGQQEVITLALMQFIYV